MAEYTTNPVKDALSHILDNLSEADFKKFKHHLKGDVPWSKLENADRDDAICLIIQKYTDEHCGKTVVIILRKMNLNQAAKDLEEKEQEIKLEKLKTLEKSKFNCEQIVEKNEALARYVENQVKMEFERYNQFLLDDMAARVAAVREEVEQKSQAPRENIKKINREMSSLAVQDGRRSDEEDTSLQNGTAERSEPEPTAAPTPEYTLQDPGTLINVAKHMDDLKMTLWRKLMKMMTPMTLDPNTANPDLVLSEDLTSVQYVKKNPQRFHNNPCVLGSEGFTSGTHCWDVEVVEKTSWNVGVTGESVRRQGGNVWWIGISYVNNGFVVHNPNWIELKLTQKPQRIRLKLDWDRGELSFSDPDNDTLLHTIKHTFTEKMFPYIETRSFLRILPSR
ncbi:zinc-binding protein A33-like [Sardina pilchardus]|uniref:zinc-binding protein A33-like n=1 Tax=Sardina pilchardus TaxID=27697 RepID=UPI002E12709B